MGTMKMSKAQLIMQLREEYDRWQQLLGSLTEQQVVARELPARLSIKDVVAHLWEWQRLSVARLEAAIDNRRPDYQLGPEGLDPDSEENLERINVWIHTANLDRPWADVQRDWRDNYLHFVELAGSIPEDVLLQPARYEWLKDSPLAAVLQGSYEHHHVEHYEPLMEWLSKRGWS